MPMPRKYQTHAELLKERARRYAEEMAQRKLGRLFTPARDPELFAPWPAGMWDKSAPTCFWVKG